MINISQIEVSCHQQDIADLLGPSIERQGPVILVDEASGHRHSRPVLCWYPILVTDLSFITCSADPDRRRRCQPLSRYVLHLRRLRCRQSTGTLLFRR